ncbi:MAG TPA: hypothetical protein VJ654_01050 [Noviherbaspirillum sp.]|nr:hypothetical protein [Noviherbaspirillum sp.]
MPAADGLDAPDLPLGLEAEEPEEPEEPDAPDDEVPLLPDEVSEVLDGMVLELLLPLAPGVFCEGMGEDGDVALLPERGSAPEPALCASTTEDTDATITKDNDRSVVFNGIWDSFC